MVTEVNLESHRVVGDLPTIFYVPEYVTCLEEQKLLTEVRSSKAKWTQVSGRRLQNHGGSVHSKGCLIQQPLPSWLERIAQRMHNDTGVYGTEPPNHVLVNSYQPGEGIMPHEDGPLYYPGVCILSLGGPAVLHFTRKRAVEEAGDAAADTGEPLCSLACMPRSLLVFCGDAYTACMHGIHEVTEEAVDDRVVNRTAAGLDGTSILPRRGERISLTVRRVLKVKKNLLRL